MDKQRWKTIGLIVDEALDLPKEEWNDFIDHECPTDDKLRKEVKDLLYSIEASKGLWDELLNAHEILIEDYSQTFSHQHFDSDIPQTTSSVGPWQLIERIGRGGMGEVWRAERADGQYEQTVAIKLMRASVGLEDSYRRFRQERQILATLDHPHIARLIDGGISDDGRPYLVMEYVSGVPIIEFCKKNDCTLERRLELFGQICRAVQYAHRNLVVHRDLKPDNILVTKEGILKVLDFGIAKLLDVELTERTLIQTRPGQRMMSLHYAAPEQVTMEPVTTATDVYALGLLLYELLAGPRPFELKGKRLADAEQIIRRQEPVKPSLKAPRRQNELKGDLDAIILKALRKEPEQRYESAGQLLDDIQRYEQNLPVRARSDTVRYRVSKYLKRHSTGIAATAILLLLSVGFGLYHATQITRERNQARLEAEKARQATDFLIDVFKLSDPGENMGATITASEILERGAQKITGELKNQPRIQAALFDAIGRVYQNLGLYKQSELFLNKALALRKEEGDLQERKELAASLHHLGFLYTTMGKYDSAKVLYKQALDLMDKSDNPETGQLAEITNDYGRLHQDLGNIDTADSLYRLAMDYYNKATGISSSEVATTMNNLATLLHQQGNHTEAEPLYRQTLRIKKSLSGEIHPEVATAMNNLAALYMAQGKNREAEALFTKVLDIKRQLLPETHNSIALTMNNLGALQLREQKYNLATQHFKKALSIMRKNVGEEHFYVAIVTYNLAVATHRLKKLKEAEYLYENAVEKAKSSLPAGHPRIGNALIGLGELRSETGDVQKALTLVREGYEILQISLPPDHGQILEAESILGLCYAQLTEFEKAESYLLNSFRELYKKKDKETYRTRQALLRLITLYELWDKPAKIIHYQEQLQNFEKTSDP